MLSSRSLIVILGGGIYFLFSGVDLGQGSAYFFLIFCLGLGFFLDRDYLFVVVLLMIYLLVGLAPISSYRGVVSDKTIFLYSDFVASFYMSLSLFSFIKRKNKYLVRDVVWGRRENIFYSVHMILIWSGVIYLYAMHGNILTNQEGRFYISPMVGYLVKSGLYSGIFAACVVGDRIKKEIFKFLVLPVFPCILIGSRGNLIIYVFCVITFYYIKNGGVNLKGWAWIILAAFFSGLVITVFFYLRRGAGGSFASVDQLIAMYFTSSGFFSYAIVSLHVAFRETIGLTNWIIGNDVENFITPNPLIMADLMTVLPGEQVAAGKALGEINGAKGAGGLTPGIIGGIYLDFKSVGVLFAGVFFGVFLALARALSVRSVFWLIVFCLTLSQFVHFFHRGFVKPEYIFSYVVCFFYSKYFRVKWGGS